ncbi:MAG: Glutaredoxin-like domain-containing protein PA3033, partial [uncultured Nocardioides sp.]
DPLHPAGLPPLRGGAAGRRPGVRRAGGGLRRGRRRHRPGAPGPLHRRGPGDLRRRPAARLLARGRGPAAGRAGAL